MYRRTRSRRDTADVNVLGMLELIYRLHATPSHVYDAALLAYRMCYGDLFRNESSTKRRKAKSRNDGG